MPPRRFVALAALVAAALFAAAWFDLLPGGWRLRGVFVSRAAVAHDAYLARRAERLALFARENASVPAGAVVFLGSSTIERFPLAACFPGARTVERGIGSEPLDDLLARLPDSLPQAELAGLVVYAASIDFRADPTHPEALAARIARVVERLGELRPGVPVCVLGVLPERAMSAADVAHLARLETELARVVRARGASFVPTARPPLADERGALADAFSSDRLHLASDGYTVLARWILAEGGPVGRALAP